MKASEKRLRVVSYGDGQFTGRESAGQLLAVELAEYKGRNVVVLGIPRGGVIVASAIARSLDVELDIVLARKLRAPMNPEFAIGAITENGKVFLDSRFTDTVNESAPYVTAEKSFQMDELQRRSELFRAIKDKVSLANKLVIITDDGLATGSTMEAAIWAARQENPAKIIAAIPVAPNEALVKIAALADETVCLKVPTNFFGVGQFYRNFQQQDDLDVIDELEKSLNHYEQELVVRAV